MLNILINSAERLIIRRKITMLKRGYIEYKKISVQPDDTAVVAVPR